MKEEKLSMGIDLGGTNIKGVLLNEQGERLKEWHAPTQDGGDGSKWKQQIAKWLTELKELYPKKAIPVGIAAPGLADEKNGKISFMPGRMFGLAGFEWRDFLNRDDVFVLNDAHAATIAERDFGAGKAYRDFLLLTLGTGVGGGVIIDRKLHQGMLQRAGHLGHIPVSGSAEPDIFNTPGSLEDSIGNATVAKRTYGRYQNNHELVAAYEQGDPWATYCWLQSVKDLAACLSGLINAFSPEAIILSGGLTAAKKSLYEPLADFLSLFEWRPDGFETPILQAQFANWSGAVGAAAFAKEMDE